MSKRPFTDSDRAKAKVCQRCPACRHARRHQRGFFFWLVQRVESRFCPFCRACERVRGQKAHVSARHPWQPKQTSKRGTRLNDREKNNRGRDLFCRGWNGVAGRQQSGYTPGHGAHAFICRKLPLFSGDSPIGCCRSFLVECRCGRRVGHNTFKITGATVLPE